MGEFESGSLADAIDVPSTLGSGNREVALSWSYELEDQVREREDVAPRLSDRIHRKMFLRAFLVCFGIGIAGILPDIDHVIALVPRSWHFPIAILGGCIFCLGLALDIGLHYRSSRKHRMSEREAREHKQPSGDTVLTTISISSSPGDEL